MPRLRGGVIKRGSTWSYVIRVTDPATGVSRPRWVGGFRTEDEAKTARDEARRRARRGEYVDRTAVTVAEYLRQWLAAHSLETKPKTLAGYRWLVEHYVIPRIGGVRMQAVRPSDLSTLYRGLLDGGGRGGRPLSRGTVDAVHAVLRKAFNDAVTSEQVLESSPVVRAKRPRATKGERGEVWSPADLARFLSFAQSHRLYAFFYVAAFTGARRGELLNLSWSDVDLAAGVLRITGSTAVVERQRVVGSTKGGRRRTVSIDDSTVRVLRAYRARQVEEQLVVETDWPDSDLVFRTAFGEPLYPDTLRSSCRSLSAGTTSSTPTSPWCRCGCTISVTSTRRLCCWRASRCTWSRRGWVTAIPTSRCGFTPTCCRTSRRLLRMRSRGPSPGFWRTLRGPALAVVLARMADPQPDEHTETLLTSASAGAPGETRTPNLLIRSQMLYPLSYGCSADPVGNEVRF